MNRSAAMAVFRIGLRNDLSVRRSTGRFEEPLQRRGERQITISIAVRMRRHKPDNEIQVAAATVEIVPRRGAEHLQSLHAELPAEFGDRRLVSLDHAIHIVTLFKRKPFEVKRLVSAHSASPSVVAITINR